MVSLVQTPPELKFADDLKTEQLKLSLPVIHCREYGTTGWGGHGWTGYRRLVDAITDLAELLCIYGACRCLQSVSSLIKF